MKAVVAYHSRTGKTRRAAETIAAALNRTGDRASIVPLERLTAMEVQDADVVFLGTWAQGLFVFAVRPAGIKAWLPGMPSLEGKPVGLFATYRLRQAGLLDKFTDGVVSKGARVIAVQALRAGDVAPIPAFVEAVRAARSS